MLCYAAFDVVPSETFPRAANATYTQSKTRAGKLFKVPLSKYPVIILALKTSRKLPSRQFLVKIDFPFRIIFQVLVHLKTGCFFT